MAPAPWKQALLVAAMAVPPCVCVRTDTHTAFLARDSLCDAMHHWSFSFYAVR
uniref:Uncharacterized protein n=1 Tax=Arundo donax TaxID=35708 RepID=A0A0A9UAE4_ARUDO